MINNVIKELAFRGEGAGYSERGRRNPVRDDTQNLLTAITAATRPLVILELGTAFGLSGLCLLRGSPESHLVTVEFDEATAEVAKGNFRKAGVGDKVTVISGNASDIIEDLVVRADMLFLDHEKKLYLPNFLKLQERQMLTGRAVILADNVTDRYAECGDFVEMIKKTYPQTCIVPTECGLLVCRF